jgi:hypothetical protein
MQTTLKRIPLAAAIAVLLALASPLAAPAASWTNDKPNASWTNASWTNAKPNASRASRAAVRRH